MNQEYSKINIGKRSYNKKKYELSQNIESYRLSIDDTYLENTDPLYSDYPKLNNKIKNFITFLKLIDKKIN
ncbi:MAG TPA: hypothetical protein VN704_10330 [Verrucomicrobiae bacterium]|nr:hypothetical protein [Verrucomicrobiae bacterium]